jgi:hypothetical protein
MAGLAREAEAKASELEKVMKRKEEESAALQQQLSDAKRMQLQQAQAMVDQSVVMASRCVSCSDMRLTHGAECVRMRRQRQSCITRQ